MCGPAFWNRRSRLTGSRRWASVPHGRDPARRYHLLYAGRLAASKGVFEALEILAEPAGAVPLAGGVGARP